MADDGVVLGWGGGVSADCSQLVELKGKDCSYLRSSRLVRFVKLSRALTLIYSSVLGICVCL